jgi:hypothetical protein
MEAAGPFSTTRHVDGLGASFAQACEAAGMAVDDYVIGGSPVSLQCATPELRARLTPAFAHLRTSARDASTGRGLTVRLWDSASTGAEPPPLPAVPPGEASGALYHFHEPPLRVAYQPGVDALSVFDADAGVASYWVRSAAHVPSWEAASPIRQILFWWLGSRSYLQVHGGAVGTADAGALIVGPAGGGKSTTALACLGSELLYAGDDYVAVTLEPSPRIASLYNSAKLDPSHLHERFSHLLPLVANGERLADEKAVLYVHEHFPRQTTPGVPLTAVVIPSYGRTDGAPTLVPASRAAALIALGPSTMFQLHTGGTEELAALRTLVARLPCYSLELGGDLERVPEALDELLTRL